MARPLRRPVFPLPRHGVGAVWIAPEPSGRPGAGGIFGHCFASMPSPRHMFCVCSLPGYPPGTGQPRIRWSFAPSLTSVQQRLVRAGGRLGHQGGRLALRLADAEAEGPPRHLASRRARGGGREGLGASPESAGSAHRALPGNERDPSAGGPACADPRRAPTTRLKSEYLSGRPERLTSVRHTGENPPSTRSATFRHRSGFGKRFPISDGSLDLGFERHVLAEKEHPGGKVRDEGNKEAI